MFLILFLKYLMSSLKVIISINCLQLDENNSKCGDGRPHASHAFTTTAIKRLAHQLNFKEMLQIKRSLPNLVLLK